MLSSLFSKIFADEEPADDKEAPKAEEATQAKTEETSTEAVEEEAEAEEPEDVSSHRQPTPKIVKGHSVFVTSPSPLLFFFFFFWRELADSSSILSLTQQSKKNAGRLPSAYH